MIEKMLALKIKQIGLVLCVMAAILTASPAACTCSHHEETNATESDCHSHHESAETTETAETGNAVDDSCVCAIDQRLPSVASTTVGKELKSSEAVVPSNQNVGDLEFVAIATFHVALPTLTNDLSYSSTLKSFLPARAPPRL